ncbi:protein artemis isoform X2 [Pseudomyrmex gracilis]|uniref:protein artemis isoform X2 n=1 Tax=Pseudomyrmex gracilis TaxID=219809 RepID=UPI0009954C35|nr:protein artemis isoform X2 [Pseudomyrmex gracilis]
MSTFLGCIEEIPGISVDRFDGEKHLRSSAYFLSHCHTDHMKGLNNDFFRFLSQKKKYLYCSPISKAFLLNKYNFYEDHIETYVKEINVDQKVLIAYKNETDLCIYVTCISAGHCPGSVMFLFEKNDEVILYTGDFRINSRDYKKIAPLHVCNEFGVFPKKLTKLYLDTTFLDPNFASFPSRKECINVMCKVVTDWLEKSPRNVVVLECSALYGSEFLYKELSISMNTRIHIKDYVYNSYCRISDLAHHITNDPLSTRIHACTDKSKGSDLKCRDNVSKDNILTIVPSVMKWKGKDTSVIGKWDNCKEKMFNVCYATHASFDELKKFIQYFNPNSIHACVCKEHEKLRVYDVLNKIQNEVRTDNKDNTCEKYTLQILKHEKIKKKLTDFYLSNTDDS